MGKDLIGFFIILIFIFLLLKDAKGTGAIISSLANQTSTTVATLQGRYRATGPTSGTMGG
jgi:hypothetical protein